MRCRATVQGLWGGASGTADGSGCAVQRVGHVPGGVGGGGLGTGGDWDGEMGCGGHVAPILKDHRRILVQIPRLWHKNKCRP